MPPYRIEHETIDGVATVALLSEEGQLKARFAPAAGMVGCSLAHRGDELLELGQGLAHYARAGGTMGIPFLHPWANRLSEFSFPLQGQEVRLEAASRHLHRDPNGLPIHGLMAGWPRWEVVEAAADDSGARLRARFDFAAAPTLMTAFPFAHELEIEVALRGTTLRHSTTLRPSGDRAVPVSFGYHPYFRLPGQPAEAWHIDAPVRRHIVVDRQMIPTGEHGPGRIDPGPLGDRTFDDGFDDLPQPARFSITGSGRQLIMEFLRGYSVAVVWRPPGGQFICFEPMTAPTNALVAGRGFELVAPGETFTAEFAVVVGEA